MSRTITNNSSLLPGDTTIFCNCQNNPIVVTLLDATSGSLSYGQTFSFVKTDLSRNTLTIVPINNQFIEDVQSITLQSDSLFNNSYQLEALTNPGIWKNPKSMYPLPPFAWAPVGSTGGSGAPTTGQYIITGAANPSLPNAFNLLSLTAGLLKTDGSGNLVLGTPNMDYLSPYVIVPINSTYPGAGVTNQLWFLTDATGSFIASLPAGSNGQIISCHKTNSSVNSITISATGGATIEGNPSVTLSARYDQITLVYYNGVWYTQI
jgi:hypothetical protein